MNAQRRAALVAQASAEVQRDRKRAEQLLEILRYESVCLKQFRDDPEYSNQQQEYHEIVESLQAAKDHRKVAQDELEQLDLMGKCLRGGREGGRAWDQLTRENKWRKAIVLALVDPSNDSSPCYLHKCIATNNDDDLIRSVASDRDVFLAYLNHRYFANVEYRPSGLAYLHNPVEAYPLFRIPESLLDDKEVVVALVKKYPEILASTVNKLPLPDVLLDDDDICLAYIASERLKAPEPGAFGSGRGPPMGLLSLIGKFSKRIRGNRELMLQAARSGCTVFQCFAGHISDDVTFAIALATSITMSKREACKLPNNALERFSSRVRSDPSVVLQYVKGNGLCIQYASGRALDDECVVRTACKENILAFDLSVSGDIWKKLGDDKAFVLNSFCRIGCRHPNSERYRSLSQRLKRDLDIIIAAKRAASLDVSDLISELYSSQNFWAEIIQRNSSFWYDLPESFRRDPLFARSIACFRKEKMVNDVFEEFPFLAQERNIWCSIIGSVKVAKERIVAEDWGFFEDNDPGDFGDGMAFEALPNLLRKAPTSILADRTLMLKACSTKCCVIEELGSELQIDREFVEAIVSDPSKDAVHYFPKSAQRLFPDLMIRCIQQYPYSVGENSIVEDLWTNLDVMEAFVQHEPKAQILQPPDAIHVGHTCARRFGAAATADHRNNKVYMLRAVQIHCFLWVYLSDNLRNDLDLACAAFGSEDERGANHLIRNMLHRSYRGPLFIRNHIPRLDAHGFLRTIANEAEKKLQAVHLHVFIWNVCHCRRRLQLVDPGQ